MQSDSVTRLLLAGIFVCLVILVGQGMRSAGSEGAGRYSVTGLRAGGPILVRVDTVTGRVWKLELRDASDRWVEFREPVAVEGLDAGPAPVPTPNEGREPGAK
jgi:hypothetical protein